MFIKFNTNCLRDRIKILNIFNPYGTLWCNGKKCEIIVTSEFKICIEIPFLTTDITELISFNICYEKINELTLKNSISNTITLIFSETGISTEEIHYTNNILYSDPNDTEIKSISFTKKRETLLDEFELASNLDTDMDNDDNEPILSHNLKVIKNDSGYLTIGYMSLDNFKYNSDIEYKYRLDPSAYNDVAVIFKIEMGVLVNLIKKLVSTKTSNIEIQFLKTYVKMKAFRNDNIKNSIIDESTFSFSIIQTYKRIQINKYKIPLDLFCLLKKLNISISDFCSKDKKIYNSIQFNAIIKNGIIIGLCIYPGSINDDKKNEIKKYFIFMPINEY